MTYNELVEKFQELGLEDYHLFNIADYDVIFGKHERIKGYNSLTEEDKVMFNHRLIQFINGWGLNAKLTFKPISVNKVDDYLRFDVNIQGYESWYHFTKGNGIY